MQRARTAGSSILLPRWVSTENYSACGVVRLAWSARYGDCKKSKPLPADRAPRRAEEWRQLLASGEVTSRAALARRAGVSRARVTQVLGKIVGRT
jgi:hypothetical protein